MNFTVTDLNHYRTILKPTLERNGFGLVELPNPYAVDEVLAVRLWARVDEEGIPSGGEVGTLEKQMGYAGERYTLTLCDFHLSRERIHGLLTDILNHFVRGEKLAPIERA